jgi:predicted amidohydrolase
VRFPEMYIPLVNKMGAQILLVPSAFTIRKLKGIHSHFSLDCLTSLSLC